jgi:hypothetical protein
VNRSLRAFCSRLIVGQHPEDQVELLEEVMEEIVKFAGVSRTGLTRLIGLLAARYHIMAVSTRQAARQGCTTALLHPPKVQHRSGAMRARR